MVTIPNLTELTTPNANDDMIIETGAGTRRVTRRNVHLRRTELEVLVPSNINLGADLVWFSDASDNALKGITFFDVLFGNYTNLSVAEGLALDPALHNIRPLQLNGTFALPLTISDTTPGIGGAAFNIFNFSSGDVTLNAIDSMTMFDNAAVEASRTIRENAACTIQVNDAGDECIFAGG